MRSNLATKELTAPLRVALYIRVSTDEQAIKGLSLEAQKEDLTQYAKEQGWEVAGIYIDAAKTARKKIYKREEFQRMLLDVQAGKIDRILCTRLDRWFRNVGDYYKVMEVLEKNRCDWSCTQEQFDSSTAGGRLYINMKLSIAQNEADQTGERINAVFNNKIQNGTVVSGKVPFWLRVNEEKRLEVIPENADILRDAFNKYESIVSLRATIKYIRETYGINWCDATFRRMLSDKLAIGIYDKNGRYNPNFCEPVISQKQFDNVQSLLSKNIKLIPKGNIYLFSSLLVCAECKHIYTARANNGYIYYTCKQHYSRGVCSNNKNVREDRVEQWLLDNLQDEIERLKYDFSISAAEKKRSASRTEKAAIKNKLTKLKELYMNDLIDIDEYRKDYEVYSAALKEIPEEEEVKTPDFGVLDKVLSNKFKQVYADMDRASKRAFWRSMLSSITVDNTGAVVGVTFR